MVTVDQQWVEKDLFSVKGRKLASNLKLRCHPPEDSPCQPGVPKQELFHIKALSLWMPRHLGRIDFRCPQCTTPQSLRSKGIYNNIQLVMGLKDSYYLSAKYMECKACNRTYIAYDERILC